MITNDSLPAIYTVTIRAHKWLTTCHVHCYYQSTQMTHYLQYTLLLSEHTNDSLSVMCTVTIRAYKLLTTCHVHCYYQNIQMTHYLSCTLLLSRHNFEIFRWNHSNLVVAVILPVKITHNNFQEDKFDLWIAKLWDVILAKAFFLGHPVYCYNQNTQMTHYLLYTLLQSSNVHCNPKGV